MNAIKTTLSQDGGARSANSILPTAEPIQTGNLDGLQWVSASCDVLPMAISRYWLDEKGYEAKSLFATCIAGDSMAPVLHDGDIIVFNRDQTTPESGRAFALSERGTAFIARLVLCSDGWLITRDNTDKEQYPNRPLTRDTIILGRAVLRHSDYMGDCGVGQHEQQDHRELEAA